MRELAQLPTPTMASLIFFISSQYNEVSLRLSSKTASDIMALNKKFGSFFSLVLKLFRKEKDGRPDFFYFLCRVAFSFWL